MIRINEMPELIDEYLVRIYKIVHNITEKEKNEFIDSMSTKGWSFVREDEVIDGIRLKFTKGINDFAAD